jgi:hypothetical protein
MSLCRKFAAPLILGLFILLQPSPCQAADGILQQRMAELTKLFCEKPKVEGKLFHESFLAAVPPDRLKRLARSLFEKHGTCTEVVLLERKGRWSGVFELVFEKDVSMQSTLTLNQSEPFSVIGWWIGPPMPAAKSLGEIIDNLRQLPGTTSFAAARLIEKEPRIIASLNPDMALPIGSTFKLYILGAVAQADKKGRLKWTSVVPLRKEYRSFPSGKLQDWPEGAPVTVHTLASLMISISDNTATDHLLFTVGRKAVEAMLGPMGNRHAQRNIPFLSTLELFKIKCGRGGSLAKRYLGLKKAARLRFLDEELKGVGRDAVAIETLIRPLHVDTLEWFASAADLIRAMDWFRRIGAEPDGKEILDILAINRGLQISSREWPYIGFKGGSEPGVLNCTFLAKSQAGTWFALSAGWKNVEKGLDKVKFFGLIQKAFRVLASEETNRRAKGKEPKPKEKEPKPEGKEPKPKGKEPKPEGKQPKSEGK